MVPSPHPRCLTNRAAGRGPYPDITITDLAEQESVTDAYVCWLLPRTYQSFVEERVSRWTARSLVAALRMNLAISTIKFAFAEGARDYKQSSKIFAKFLVDL
jgi:hypothetical protein